MFLGSQMHPPQLHGLFLRNIRNHSRVGWLGRRPWMPYWSSRNLQPSHTLLCLMLHGFAELFSLLQTVVEHYARSTRASKLDGRSMVASLSLISSERFMLSAKNSVTESYMWEHLSHLAIVLLCAWPVRLVIMNTTLEYSVSKVNGCILNERAQGQRPKDQQVSCEPSWFSTKGTLGSKQGIDRSTEAGGEAGTAGTGGTGGTGVGE